MKFTVLLLGAALVAGAARAQTFTASDRRAVAANLGMRESDVASLEVTCAKGLPGICRVLQEYRNQSARRLNDEEISRARLACSQGDSASCNALALDARSQRDARGEARNALVVRYSGSCATGDSLACRRLSDLSPR